MNQILIGASFMAVILSSVARAQDASDYEDQSDRHEVIGESDEDARMDRLTEEEKDTETHPESQTADESCDKDK